MNRRSLGKRKLGWTVPTRLRRWTPNARGFVMERRGWKRRVAKRGGLAAHVVTFTNLGCGFAVLLLLHEGQVNLAVSLMFLAMVLDFFDGALARMAGHGSAFGKELDSLADLVSFGVAPAFLVYQALNAPSALAAGLVSLSFVVAGAWRLALFNVAESGRDFRGMPITVAGGLMAAIAHQAHLAGNWPWPVLAFFTVGLAGLMVCRVKFVKLSRVLVPAIRKLPDEIRWTVVLLTIPTVAIIMEPSSAAVMTLGAIYVLYSLLDNRRPSPTPTAAKIGEEAAH
ncbi:MAG: CDP-diacylglycerol--serine O-phosphatidyltransferase [Chloroflexi bacterium]|nr:CDP-diacylglycerol--serine O-phosphatidyltransferase [Chloroflexota bacterium]